jgi:6-phosphogluconolactonase
MSPVSITAAADLDDLAARAAALLVEALAPSAGAEAPVIVLAGGRTPRAAYERAAAAAPRGPRLSSARWVFGDERWVPVAHPESNEGMARAALLGPLGVPEAGILSWRAGAGDPVPCAEAYAARLSGLGAPTLTFLGMGPDGHTASLFPGASARRTGGRREPVGPALSGTTAAMEPAGARGWRLTLCPALLCSSRVVVFLVSGAEKGPALRRMLDGVASTPAAWIRGEKTIVLATRDVLDAAEETRP